MEWPLALLVIFGGLVVLMATGMPIAFAFFLTCTVGSILFWGGMVGLDQLAMSFYSSVTTFILLPLPLFILLGEILYASGIGMDMVDDVDRLLGRLPGRLTIVAIAAGTLLGAPIGISAGCIAILGKNLLPEMIRRGYKKPMTLGPIVITGTLGTMLPPSALAIFMGAIGKVSIGQLTMAIIMPGLVIAVLSSVYVIIRCKLQPSLAPSYAVARVPLRMKVKAMIRSIVPVGVICFAAIGLIFLGVATPTEAAALGTMACIVLTVLYKRFNITMVKKAAVSTIEITVMVFMIIVGSISFGRILASSGAIIGLVNLATSLPVPPMVI